MGVMEILFDDGAQATPRFAADEIVRRITEAFPDAQVKVDDLTGTGDHYQVAVISQAFVGKAPLKRHRMIYGLFDDVIGKELHALALTCQTPQS